MSRYSHFNDFMSSVLEHADTLCRSRRGCSLAAYCKQPSDAFSFLTRLLSAPWPVASATFALMDNPPWIWASAFAFFLSSPMGMILVVSLALGKIALQSGFASLYACRALPMALRKVGEAYQPQWKSAGNSHSAIDHLHDTAAAELLQKMGA